MSRPFSYHDEDMDVIGNILFIHTAFDNGKTESTTAFTIPSEVMARVMKNWLR